MSQFRTSAAVLGGAVATALALTASPLSSPFLAAPAHALAHPGAQGGSAVPAAPLKIAPGSQLLSAGPTGLQTYDGEGRVWTKYADGSQTRLGPASQWPSTGDFGAVSDIVATHEKTPPGTPAGPVTLTDTATGSATTIPLSASDDYVGTVGGTVLVSRDLDGGETALYLLDRADGGSSPRKVTGLPSDIAWFDEVAAATPGRALVQYGYDSPKGPGGGGYALVDLADGRVLSVQSFGGYESTWVALSASHVAVVSSDHGDEADPAPLLRVVDLRTGEVRESPSPLGKPDLFGIVGDWFVYGNRTPVEAGSPGADHTLKAVPIAGGTPRTLLDHATSLAAAPDGGLLASGGTLAAGEGVYRISVGANGAPAVSLTAGTGEPTKVEVLETDVEKAVALDERSHRMRWKLSRTNVKATVTITHTATGQTGTWHPWAPPAGPGWVDLDWARNLATPGRPLSAPNGDYTWKATFTPVNGIGPATSATGAFKVTRKSHPHDYTDNGTPDLLDRDSAGRLWLHDAVWNPRTYPTGEFRERKQVPGNWAGYDRIVAAGNAAGAAAGDLVSRDSAGVLWLHLGKANGTFDTRIKVGAGWKIYKQLTALGDVTNDGRADLLATDAAGVMWLYRGTGSWKTPYLPRKKAGAGWQGYNKILSVGDIGGAKAGDLVARDSAGVLWFMQGKGDGTFAPRVKIEAGWGGFPHLVGLGDGDRDGRPDLFASNARAEYLYRSTGDAVRPFNWRYTLRQDYPGNPVYTSVF
ncbi:FG-GAP repeat domain-containing protein [Streptomyces sp. NPDC002073]